MSALARRDLIDGSNLQPSLVQRFSDLLGQQLGFFGSDLDVRMSLEERANRRGDDGIHLVRIIHFLHAKLRMTSPDRRCVSLQDRDGHRKPKTKEWPRSQRQAL